MRLVLGFLAVLMLMAVAVQYNDPDGPLWMLYYGVPAVWAGLAALRPAAVLGTAGRALLIATTIAAALLTVWYWPPVDAWWRVDVWWHTEEAREGMGLMIVTVVLAIVLAAAFLALPRHRIRSSGVLRSVDKN
jgi:hypothetical protein